MLHDKVILKEVTSILHLLTLLTWELEHAEHMWCVTVTRTKTLYLHHCVSTINSRNHKINHDLANNST